MHLLVNCAIQKAQAQKQVEVHAARGVNTNLPTPASVNSHEGEDDGGGMREVGQRLVRDMRRGGYVDVRGKRWDGQRDAARQRTCTTYEESVSNTCEVCCSMISP